MAEQLFVIVHHRGPAWKDGLSYLDQPAIGGHIEFMSSLSERGSMVLGGPYTDHDATGIVGMAIVRAASLEDAEALAAEDPTVIAGLIAPRVRPWRAVMGTALGRD
jgi:uncharacterized protein YciI